MNRLNDEENIARLYVAEVISDVAPSESHLVEYYNGPKNTGSVSRGPLGIGIEAAIPLVLPIVWTIVKGILESARDEFAKDLYKTLYKKYITKESSTATANPDLEADLTKTVEEELKKQGNHEADANKIALAILQSLSQERTNC